MAYPLANPLIHHLFQTTSMFDANTVQLYQDALLHSPSLFPVFFSESCLASDDDFFLDANRPPVPAAHEYVIPRRKIVNDDVLTVEREKEDQICALFRADGYQFRAGLYREIGKEKELRYLRLWRMVNQHIPEFYISEGTRNFEPPVDALLAAIVEDVELGDGV
jgi:hypothetical protein